MSESDDSPTPAKVQKLSTSVLEISSDADCSLADVETQHALEDIDDCQKEIDLLNEKASEEILQVEMKYNKLRRPHFQKRNELTQRIANFWVTVFLNHPQMANLVEEEEEECLHYLKQVDVEEFEDIKSGYCISFQFARNPFFTNEILTKEYHLTSADGKPVSRSAKIHWKANMNLLQQRQTLAKGHKRQRHRNSSFFAWFIENADPSRDRIAEMIKEDIWPNPLQYYLASDIEVEENGISEDDSDNDRIVEDDSVVIVGDDDDDDDDDVYEVEDDDNNEDRHEETVESIEVEDDDDCDDDAVEVLGSDSEEDVSCDVAEISQDAEELLETNDISQMEEAVVDLEEATTLTKNHVVSDIHDGKDGNYHKDNNDLKEVNTETDSDLLRSAGEGGEGDGKTVNVPDSSNAENALKTVCTKTGDSSLGVK